MSTSRAEDSRRGLRARRRVLIALTLIAAALAALAVFAVADRPFSAEKARRQLIETAKHLVRYLDERNPALLGEAKRNLDTVPAFANEFFAPEQRYHYSIQQERDVLERVAGHLLEPSRNAARLAPEQRLFERVLQYVSREDYRLLRVHLGGVIREFEEVNRMKTGLPEARSDQRGIEHCAQSLFVLTNPERWATKFRKAADFLDLQRGTRVVDIGCGAAFFLLPILDRVGPEGHVFQVDIDPCTLAFVDFLIDAEGLENVQTVLSQQTNINVAGDSADRAFINNLFFGIEAMTALKKRAFYETVHKALRKHGTFVVCDDAVTYDGMRLEEGIERLEAAGFRHLDDFSAGTYYCIKVGH